MFSNNKTAEAFLNETEILAEQRKERIINSESNIDSKKKCFYVSMLGNDNNSGLSPKTPWKTLEKVNGLEPEEECCVLFKRGDTFRGQLRLKNGVSYSAYGEGKKPEIYGSPENGAAPEKWFLEDETNNIWVFYKELLDVGTIVFNEGEECGYKSLPSFVNCNYVVRNSDEIYDFHKELNRDLMFFSKCDTELENEKPKKFAKGKLYLKCDKGNPGEIFNSIEFNTRRNIVEGAMAKNVTVDNLCIKYGGSHGIGAGWVENFTVSNCEIGWIGGGVLYYNKKNEAVRYGNAVEVYTKCDGYCVKNNYIYQCYDTGITHQAQPIGGDGTFKDVTYSGNLIEKCIWSIEYYHGNPDPKNVKRLMKNIIFEDNILRKAGEGFGTQRLTGNNAAHIMSWWFHENKAENFIIKNNIFDRSSHCLIQINAAEQDSLPDMSGNKYIHKYGSIFGRYGKLPSGLKYEDVQLVFDEEAETFIKEKIEAENCEIYFLK